MYQKLITDLGMKIRFIDSSKSPYKYIEQGQA